MGNELSQNPNTTKRIGGVDVRFIKKIGEGGYSFVFLVEDAVSGRQYALKRCITSDREGSLLVEKEISILRQLSQLNNPHFMKYITHQSAPTSGGGNEYYILTEYCAGGSLINEIQSYLDRKQLYPEGKMVVVLESIFKALHAMHTLPTPTAHRDIKLENVLRSSNGVYKLCDFGSTSTVNKVFTESSEMLREEGIINKQSTEMYRSPELCDLYRAKNNQWVIGPKADIWAVGNILYTLAYQCHPFEDGGHMAVLSGRITFPDPQKEPKYKIYTPYVNYIISQCFTTNPNKRKSAAEMLHLIDSWKVYLQSNCTQHGDPSIAEEVMTWIPRVVNDSNSLPKAPVALSGRTRTQLGVKQAGRQQQQQLPQHAKQHQHQQHHHQHQHQKSLGQHDFVEAEFDVDWSDGDENDDTTNTNTNTNTRANNYDDSFTTYHGSNNSTITASPPPSIIASSSSASGGLPQNPSFTSPIRRGMNTANNSNSNANTSISTPSILAPRPPAAPFASPQHPHMQQPSSRSQTKELFSIHPPTTSISTHTHRQQPSLIPPELTPSTSVSRQPSNTRPPPRQQQQQQQQQLQQQDSFDIINASNTTGGDGDGDGDADWGNDWCDFESAFDEISQPQPQSQSQSQQQQQLHQPSLLFSNSNPTAHTNSLSQTVLTQQNSSQSTFIQQHHQIQSQPLSPVSSSAPLPPPPSQTAAAPRAARDATHTPAGNITTLFAPFNPNQSQINLPSVPTPSDHGGDGGYPRINNTTHPSATPAPTPPAYPIPQTLSRSRPLHPHDVAMHRSSNPPSSTVPPTPPRQQKMSEFEKLQQSSAHPHSVTIPNGNNPYLQHQQQQQQHIYHHQYPRPQQPDFISGGPF